MDLHKINRPQDYNKFYHTSSEGLDWLDGKGNPIPLSHTHWVLLLRPSTELSCGTQSKPRARSTDKIYQSLAMATLTVLL